MKNTWPSTQHNTSNVGTLHSPSLFIAEFVCLPIYDPSNATWTRSFTSWGFFFIDLLSLPLYDPSNLIWTRLFTSRRIFFHRFALLLWTRKGSIFGWLNSLKYCDISWEKMIHCWSQGVSWLMKIMASSTLRNYFV